MSHTVFWEVAVPPMALLTEKSISELTLAVHSRYRYCDTEQKTIVELTCRGRRRHSAASLQPRGGSIADQNYLGHNVDRGKLTVIHKNATYIKVVQQIIFIVRL